MTDKKEDVKQTRKAKRKLSDIDFSVEGAHLALVSEEQGHGANGHHYALVMKAVNPEKDSPSTEEDNPSAGDVTEVTEINEGVESSIRKSKKGKTKMTDEKVTEEVTSEVERVEKAQFDLVQKALEEQSVKLQKALDLVAKYETEQKEAVLKARKNALVEAAGDEAHATAIFKACSEVDDSTFEGVVTALQGIKKASEAGEMFSEVGASAPEEAQDTESGLSKLIKATYYNK